MRRPCSPGCVSGDTYVGMSVRASSTSEMARFASCAISNCESCRPLSSAVLPSRSGCAACLIKRLGEIEYVRAHFTNRRLLLVPTKLVDVLLGLLGDARSARLALAGHLAGARKEEVHLGNKQASRVLELGAKLALARVFDFRIPAAAPLEGRLRHRGGRRISSTMADAMDVEAPGMQYELLYTLHGHARSVACAVFSPNGEHLATAGADKAVQVWATRTGRLQHTLQGHTGGVNAVCWTRDSQYVVSASDDRTVRVWELDTVRVVSHTGKNRAHVRRAHVLCLLHRMPPSEHAAGQRRVRRDDPVMGPAARNVPPHDCRALGSRDRRRL